MTGQTDVEFDVPSSYPLDRAMREALREPFPSNLIAQVNKGFGQVDYIGHAAITDRLNQAAPGWTYRVEPVVITGKDGLPHVMAVFGTMTVGGVTRQEVGDVEHMSRYGDELKKAISDFICRGAMRFGVGLDLWSKEDLSESAPIRGRSEGADGTGRVDTTSSTGPTSSSDIEPKEPVADSVIRTTSEDSSSEGTTSAVLGEGAAGPSDSSPGGDSAQGRGADPPGDAPKKRRAKKYALDPKLCKHTVGIDLDLRCVDCGTKMAEASA